MTAVVFLTTINLFAQRDSVFKVTYAAQLSHISIRALEAVNDSTAWFAANHGVWGFTKDGGKTWHIDSITADSIYPEFRSISVLNDSTVLLLGVASPAYIFKTTDKGRTWRLVYKNPDKNIFFDSMKFEDINSGFAIADPIDGCVQLISTTDGGEIWNQIACANIPKATEGEMFFASSNTNIDVFESHVWFGTGGKQARVFTSKDKGLHFDAFNTPVKQGGKMTGIFSLDFFDDKTGLVVGGNYELTDSSIIGIALTHDGGKTWKAIKEGKRFFGSCVQFKSPYLCFITGHDGTFIGNFKTEKFIELRDQNNKQLKFHTLRFSPTGKVLWLAGDKGRIAFITLAQ